MEKKKKETIMQITYMHFYGCYEFPTVFTIHLTTIQLFFPCIHLKEYRHIFKIIPVVLYLRYKYIFQSVFHFQLKTRVVLIQQRERECVHFFGDAVSLILIVKSGN